MSRRTLYLIAAAGLAVFLGSGGFLLVNFFSGNEPSEVSLEDTAGQAVPLDDAENVGFEGQWTVDNTSGDFDYASGVFTSTYAGYRVDERLDPIGANTAVGRTRNVEGTMTIEANRITAVEVTVDMQSLESDEDRRDNTLRDRGLESATYPTAVFRLTQPIVIDTEPAVGETINAEAVGELTLHGVTRQVTAPLEARWDGTEITVVSGFDVALDDYNIERPTVGFVLSVADVGRVELQLRFRKGSA